MKALELPDGTREVRRSLLTPEKAPRWFALANEAGWLHRASSERWLQGH